MPAHVTRGRFHGLVFLACAILVLLGVNSFPAHVTAATGGVVATPCDSRVEVTFPDPGNNNYAWEVTQLPSGGTVTFYNSFAGFTWFGLTNGTTYTFSVKQAGTGLFIGESDPVTPLAGLCASPTPVPTTPPSPTPQPEREPRIAISPSTRINFGFSEPDQLQQQEFQIQNVGPVGSVLTGSITNLYEPFSILSGGGNFSLARGETRTVVVGFQPTTLDKFRGRIEIISNARNRPLVAMNLLGEAIEVRIWINAFIPRVVPDVTYQVPNRPRGETMILGLASIGQVGFLTDQRTFSRDIAASSRMRSSVTITANAQGPRIKDQFHKCDMTVVVDDVFGLVLFEGFGSNEEMSFELQSVDSTQLAIRLQARSQVPFYEYGVGNPAPYIDYEGTLYIDTEQRTVTFEGLVDEFPAFEMYVSVNNRPGKRLFTLFPEPGKSPVDLFGPAYRQVNGAVRF
jgi:hypothetical protein